MALGVLLELLILVAVIALIVRGAGNGHLVFWLAAAAGIVLVVGLALAVVWSYERRGMERQQSAQIEYQALADHLAERRARGEDIPDMYGELTHGPEMHGEAATWVKGGVFLMVLMLPMAAFGALRAHRRGGAGPWLLAGGGVAAVLLIGLIGIRFSSVTHTSYPPLQPPVVDVAPFAQAPLDRATMPDMPVAVEEPIDEAMDRFDEPQIKLEEDAPTTTAEAAPAEDAAVTTAEQSMQAQDGAVVATMVLESGADNEDAPEVSEAAPVADGGDDETTTEVEGEDIFADAAAPTTEEVAEQNSAEVEDADIFAEATPTEAAGEPAAGPAPPRPDWVDNPPKLAGPVQRIVIEAGPYTTLTECQAALRDERETAVRQRVRDLASEWLGRGAYVPDLESMRLGNDYIVHELLADQYVEASQTETFGDIEMKTAWALLEFDQVDDARLLEAWQGYARRDGVAITAVCSALVLAVLGLVFGLIKVDTWTRGYYTKRLFLGVPAAIIAVVMLLGSL